MGKRAKMLLDRTAKYIAKGLESGAYSGQRSVRQAPFGPDPSQSTDKQTRFGELVLALAKKVQANPKDDDPSAPKDGDPAIPKNEGSL